MIVRVPLRAYCYFDYKSLLIANDVPILLGLHSQTDLLKITDKNPNKPIITFKAIGVSILLVFKLGHLFYNGLHPNEYLFSIHKIVQVNHNMGHAPADSMYSALRRAYLIETGSSDLAKLKQFNERCKGCQLYSQKPNRCHALLSDQCVFSYNIAVDVIFIAS